MLPGEAVTGPGLTVPEVPEGETVGETGAALFEGTTAGLDGATLGIRVWPPVGEAVPSPGVGSEPSLAEHPDTKPIAVSKVTARAEESQRRRRGQGFDMRRS